MSDVFISYSRKDIAFVAQLRKLLEDAGLTVWVDVAGLYAGEEFWPELAKAVDATAAVVFVITPDSIASQFCRRELERAAEGQKRIVPVLHQEVEKAGLHPTLANRQWVLFRDTDDSDAAREALLCAVRADWVQLRQQARLLLRAREWQTKNRDPSLLLRGHDLREAERWLVESQGRENGPTPLHSEFIQQSRRAARGRFLRLVGSAAAAVTAILIVSWFALSYEVTSLNNGGDADLEARPPRVAQAIETLERASARCTALRSKFPACPNVAHNLGRAYLEEGRYGDALPMFSESIAQTTGTGSGNPPADHEFLAVSFRNRAFTHIMLAELQAEQSERSDHYARAQDDIDSAAKLYRSTPEVREDETFAITRARILLGQGEYDFAISDLERASSVIHTSDIATSDIELLLSIAHHCKGDRDKSLTHFSRYIESLPQRTQDPKWQLDEHYYTRIRQRCKHTR